MTSGISIAYFITPHGFGHASRAAAVMTALSRLEPRVRFELFTTCPKWIFEDTTRTEFGYHAVESDIGVVQSSPLREDLTATCRKLARMLPFRETKIRDLAERIRRLGCRAVICDIAPLGIAVARAAGLTSILMENFTWDWLYTGYLSAAPGLKPHIDYLSGINRMADYHFQTRPICCPSATAISVNPVSRSARSPADQVRGRLGIPAGAKMVLLSMGGVPDRFDFLSGISTDPDFYIVIPGADHRRSEHPGIILLPTHSDFFHPDLINAADVLIGKAGYSTIAEACQAGIPFGYITRPASPESAVLEDFIRRRLPARSISPEAYHDGSWTEAIGELLNQPRRAAPDENGADQAARHLYRIILDRPCGCESSRSSQSSTRPRRRPGGQRGGL